jgi:hypothetical protein
MVFVMVFAMNCCEFVFQFASKPSVHCQFFQAFEISRTDSSLIPNLFQRTRTDGSLNPNLSQRTRIDGSLILQQLKKLEPAVLYKFK